MSSLREWLVSTQPEEITEEQLRRGASARLVLCFSAVLIDVGIYAFFRNHPKIDPAVLQFFAVVNIVLLSLLGLITYLGHARARAPKIWLLYALMPFEILSVVIWIQVTGTISSYFIIVGPLIFVVYRGFYSHRVGLAALISLFFWHFGAYAIEELGLVRAQSLFREPPTGLYADPQFRLTAMISIAWSYLFVFIGTNLFVNQLRSRERQLATAERRLALAAEGARHGRLTGMQLADIELGELLGRGGMGEVYAGKLGSETIAVKVLHPHLVGDERIFLRFVREADAAQRVPGGFCPRVLRAASAPYPYIAMELLEGEDLAAHFRRRGLMSIDDVLELADRLAAALDAIHAAGIIHRDLTPANVFLVADHVEGDGPKVKLLDLGICKLRDGAPGVTHQSAILGTPGFLSPEQAMGRGAQVTAASDVFAFGAILYRALTGHLPFPAGDLLSAIEQVCTVEPTPPSELREDLPVEIDDVIAWAMAKNIDDRYASAGQVAADLRQATLRQLSTERRGRAASQRAQLGYAPTLSPTDAVSGEHSLAPPTAKG